MRAGSQLAATLSGDQGPYSEASQESENGLDSSEVEMQSQNVFQSIWYHEDYIHPRFLKVKDPAPMFHPAKNTSFRKIKEPETEMENLKSEGILSPAQITFLDSYITQRKKICNEVKFLMKELDNDFYSIFMNYPNLDGIESSWTLGIVCVKNSEMEDKLAHLNRFVKSAKALLSNKEGKEIIKTLKRFRANTSDTTNAHTVATSLKAFPKDLELQVIVFSEDVKYVMKTYEYDIARRYGTSMKGYRSTASIFLVSFGLAALGLVGAFYVEGMWRPCILYGISVFIPSISIVLMFLMPRKFYEITSFDVGFRGFAHFRHLVFSQEIQEDYIVQDDQGVLAHMLPLPRYTECEIKRVEERFNAGVSSLRATYPSLIARTDAARESMAKAELNFNDIKSNFLDESMAVLEDMRYLRAAFDKRDEGQLVVVAAKQARFCSREPWEKCLELHRLIRSKVGNKKKASGSIFELYMKIFSITQWSTRGSSVVNKRI